MSNPFNGVMLGGMYYNYALESYRSSVRVKATSSPTQASKMFTYNGLEPAQHYITLLLEKDYTVKNPVDNNELGITSWFGTSRLSFLKNQLGASGVPLTLVLMDGVTHAVVPFGILDVSLFRSALQEDKGVEYRVSLAFEEIN